MQQKIIMKHEQKNSYKKTDDRLRKSAFLFFLVDIIGEIGFSDDADGFYLFDAFVVAKFLFESVGLRIVVVLIFRKSVFCAL